MASSWGEGASEEKAGLTGARKAAQSGACPPRLGDSVRGSLRREQDAPEGDPDPVGVAVPASPSHPQNPIPVPSEVAEFGPGFPSVMS